MEEEAGLRRELRILLLPPVCLSPTIHPHPPRVPQFWISCLFSDFSLQLSPMYVTLNNTMINLLFFWFCLSGIVLYIFLWLFYPFNGVFKSHSRWWGSSHSKCQVLCVVAVETFHFMNIMQCIQLPVLARKGIFFGQDFCNFKQYRCCGHSCTFLLVHITSSGRVYTEKEDFWVTGNVHLQLH